MSESSCSAISISSSIPSRKSSSTYLNTCSRHSFKAAVPLVGWNTQVQIFAFLVLVSCLCLKDSPEIHHTSETYRLPDLEASPSNEMPPSPNIFPNTFLIPLTSYFILSNVGFICHYACIVSHTSVGAPMSNLLSYILISSYCPIVGLTRPFLNIFKIIRCSVYYIEAYLRYLFGFLFCQSYVY